MGRWAGGGGGQSGGSDGGGGVQVGRFGVSEAGGAIMKKNLTVSNTPYDGGWWVTDGGWWVTDGGWRVTAWGNMQT